MLIRSLRTFEDTTTLSPKPMPRIDIDTGFLQIFANVSHDHYYKFVYYLYVLLWLLKYKISIKLFAYYIPYSHYWYEK